METENPYVYTYTGKKLHFLDPHPEEITIHDIAHHLSQLCRWTGGTKSFYSVAQHSLNVEKIIAKCHPNDRVLRLQGLLHDASEAYMNDLNRPVKRFVKQYMEVERIVRDGIFMRFGLPLAIDMAVHDADEIMQHTEAQHLLPHPPDWLVRSLVSNDVQVNYPVDMGTVKKSFLDKFLELQ